jgi:two-component system NarL family sensor kinase
VDDRTAEVLLRVAKELLVNSQKHSRASRADVTLSSGPGWVRLVVTDDGVGYSQEPAHPGGFGLRSIALEIGALGGTMSCESDAGARTVVTIPIDVAAADR